MSTLARADLESLLRARKLDRTLTTALAPLDPYDEYAIAPAGVTALDASLGGGFPRGQLSELIGPRSSGRTSLVLQILAAAAGRGELVALVDALDTFDIASASAAGIDLERLLWVRGHVVTNPGMCRDINQRAVEQAVKALMLILQAGNFGCVVLDVADAPARGDPAAAVHDLAAAPAHPRREPDRLRAGRHRADGTELGGAVGEMREGKEHRSDGQGHMFKGLDLELHVSSAKGHLRDGVRVSLTTQASPYV